ncbi:putative leucine-rich repeat-containing protein DDB_G0290503 [Battus philenor]|uniref:putative leucine-rich repeat-containing protein DDB_G0290503 n=1 Tax=Battus philenor TaxID=42288 RepID=UPI0035D01CF8
MLETEEVDIDFFTPVASTSLSKIFTNDVKLEDNDNNSLKYVPKSNQIDSSKQDDFKPTQIIYACSLYGYEWSNNAYISRGKVGAAILKSPKSEKHSIILYDSNKTTLSCTNVTTKLEIVIKENTNLSYYDNYQKYWSINGTETEISGFIEKLKSFDVQIRKLSNTAEDPIESNCERFKADNLTLKDDKESDTDSAINRRTKDSILKRMATMGHSVLPMQNTNLKNSDDSSDSNENTQKSYRSKPQKINTKKKISEKLDCTDSVEINLNKIPSKNSDEIPITAYCQQVVPIKSANIIANPIVNNSSDLNLFMSEQRISNSELRMNMNRMSDKIDKILETVQGKSDLHSTNVITGFQNNIIQKLLTEYENKIKSYENFLISKGLDCNIILKSFQEQEKSLNDVEYYENKIQELQNVIDKQKEDSVKTHEEFKLLQEKYDILVKNSEKTHSDNMKELSILKENLCTKNEELLKIRKRNEEISIQNTNDIKSTLKSIMNKTFHSLSNNFNSSESYTGDTINSLIANVIKKETMEALKHL